MRWQSCRFHRVRAPATFWSARPRSGCVSMSCPGSSARRVSISRCPRSRPVRSQPVLDHAGTALSRAAPLGKPRARVRGADHRRLHRGHVEVSVQRERGAHRPSLSRQFSFRNGRVNHAACALMDPGYCSACSLAGPAGVRKDLLRWCRPPRFELNAKPGKTLRSVIEVSNRSSAPGQFVVHTADGSSSGLQRNFPRRPAAGSAVPGSRRAARNRRTRRRHIALSLRSDRARHAPPGECRFAVMIEGDQPSIARSKGLKCR